MTAGDGVAAPLQLGDADLELAVRRLGPPPIGHRQAEAGGQMRQRLLVPAPQPVYGAEPGPGGRLTDPVALVPEGGEGGVEVIDRGRIAVLHDVQLAELAQGRRDGTAVTGRMRGTQRGLVTAPPVVPCDHRTRSVCPGTAPG
jgi:hypothetical protein